MKTKLILMLLVFIYASFFQSCSKDDVNSETQNQVKFIIETVEDNNNTYKSDNTYKSSALGLVSGKVITSCGMSNSPLSGATITIKGTTSGTTSDFDGNFSLYAWAGDTLVFSYLGMASTEYTIPFVPISLTATVLTCEW